MHPMPKVNDHLRATIPKVIEPAVSLISSNAKRVGSTHRSPSPQMGSVSTSPVIGALLGIPGTDDSSLEWVREETEWEQCSRNPDVVRMVKSRNLIERNRLVAVRSQLDKELERELKRLTLERKEFSDVLDNLQRRRTESRQRNVRRSGRLRSSNAGMRESREKQDGIHRSGQWPPPPSKVKNTENEPLVHKHVSMYSFQSETDRNSSHRGSLSSVMSLPELYRVATPHQYRRSDNR